MMSKAYKKAVSVLPESIYNHPQAVECKVKLNGVELNHCVTANESEGWVQVYSKDNQGNFIIENNVPVLEKISGFVSIITPEKWIGYDYATR